LATPNCWALRYGAVHGRLRRADADLAAIIAVIMEVPAAILIVLGFFTRPLAVIFIFYTLGTAVIGHHYWDMTGDAVLPNMINFWKNVSIAGAFLLAVTGRGDLPRPPLISRRKKGAAFLCQR
jgi:uncharacterized membrane protein YphA (DoxX/SURF4 family)